MSTKEIFQPKEIVKKIQKFVIATWGRKELGVDSICILADALILTGLPHLYGRLPKGMGRIVTVFVLMVLMTAMAILLILRLIWRNRRGNQQATQPLKLEKRDYLFLGIRSVIVAAGIWIFACIMVGIIHPTLIGIYAIEMTSAEEIRITVFNSFFFVICSQAILAILTGTEENNKTFFTRLLKTWGITLLPMFLITFLLTLFTEWVRGQDTFAAGGLGIISTTFLWVTSIAIHERIKGRIAE